MAKTKTNKVQNVSATTESQQRKLANLIPFKPGQSGNPKGRPQNAKQKLSDTFLADMLEAWERDGKDAIKAVVKDRPHEFIKAVAAIVPKDVNVRTSVVQELSDDELADALAALRTAVSLAGARGGDETASRH